ncbi:14516_t:CDS:2 [Dentiscutata heterogama]|uniref:14516_t:CDS:1 n=1 Tax=Dentiscutata heterogama TaxID=1316150 RepID=A0ACA9KUM9_9GLOM|nr:14516_t:CDS:2 [Dentiscutata heterogama]
MNKYPSRHTNTTNKIKNDEIQDSFNNENTRYGDHQRRSYFWLQNNDTDEELQPNPPEPYP